MKAGRLPSGDTQGGAAMRHVTYDGNQFPQYRLSPDPADDEVPAVSTDDCTITAAGYRRDIR